MSLYFIACGSNLSPQINVPQALELLSQTFRPLHVSRMLETKPVGMATRNNFYNFCIAFESSLTPSELKRQLNKIEIIMGRDRKDENRSEKDRPMDLDIAYRTDAANPTLPPMDFEIEPWVRPLLDDLFQYVGLLAESPTLKQEFLREVVVENTKVGQRPTTLPSNAPDFSETDE